MKKQIIFIAVFSVVLFGFVFVGSALAAPGEPVNGVIVKLGIENVGTLPTSNFYFFKEWGRGIARIFTFGSINKAELELNITNEKAAEILAIKERGLDDPLGRTLANYQKSQERLAKRLESLKETSQNPNVDKLLDQLIEDTARHIELFDQLGVGVEGARVATINTTKSNSYKIINIAASKDDPEKFAKRLEKVLDESNDGDLKHLRSIEFIDDLEDAFRSTSGLKDTMKTQVRTSLGKVRADFLDKLSADLKDRVKSTKAVVVGSGNVSNIVERQVEALPGDFAKHLIILDEVRQRAEEKAKITGGIDGKDNMRVADVLSQVNKGLEKTIIEGADIKQKAEEQIKRAEGVINKLEIVINELDLNNRLNSSWPPLYRIIKEAKDNLIKAKEAFSQGKYGEAFGQARATEVTARNGLREVLSWSWGESQQQMSPGTGGKIVPESEKRVFPETNNRTACDDRQAPACLRGEMLDCRNGIWVCIGPATGSGSIGPACTQEAKLCPDGSAVSRTGPNCEFAACLTETTKPTVEKPAEGMICTQQYDPVCGADGKTYSNECMAKSAGVVVKYKGECAAP